MKTLEDYLGRSVGCGNKYPAWCNEDQRLKCKGDFKLYTLIGRDAYVGGDARSLRPFTTSPGSFQAFGIPNTIP